MSDPIVVVLQQNSPKVVRVPAGPPGPPGPAGSGAVFTYNQAVPATNWTVTHGLGRNPAGVAVYDTSNDEVIAGVHVVDSNTIDITFAFPTAGKALIT